MAGPESWPLAAAPPEPADETPKPAGPESWPLAAAPVNTSDPAVNNVVKASGPGRIVSAMHSGAEEGYGESPFGLSAESKAALSRWGIFNTEIGKTNPGASNVGTAFRGFMEASLIPAAVSLDMTLRTPGSIWKGVGDTLLESTKELDEATGADGKNLLSSHRLARDLLGMAESAQGSPGAIKGIKGIEKPGVVTSEVPVPRIEVRPLTRPEFAEAHDSGVVGNERPPISEGTPAEAAEAAAQPQTQPVVEAALAHMTEIEGEVRNLEAPLAKAIEDNDKPAQQTILAERDTLHAQWLEAEKHSLPSVVKEKFDVAQSVGDASTNPQENAWKARFDQFVGKLETGDDVKMLIKKSAEDNDRFPEARRGEVKLTNEQQGAISDASGVPPAELDMKGIGRLLQNDLQVHSAMRLMLKTTDDVGEAMKQLAAKSGVDDFKEAAALQQAIMRHDLTVEQIVGLRAEWGRTGNVFQEFQTNVKDAQSLGQFLKDKKGASLDDLRNLAKAGASVDRQGLASLLNNARKPGFYEKFMFYYMNGLLSGPFTHMKYVMANTMYTLYDAAVVTPVAGAVSALKQPLIRRQIENDIRAKVTDAGNYASVAARVQAETEMKLKDVERVYASEGFARIGGLIAALPDAMRATKDAIKNGMITPLPRQITTGEAAKNAMTEAKRNPFGASIAGKIIGAPSERGISAIHTFFNFLGYRSELEAQAARQASKEGLNPFTQRFWNRQAAISMYPTEDAMDKAVENGRRLTFTQDLGPTGKIVSHLLNNTNLGRGAKLVVPFFKVPVNIFKAAQAGSPLAFADKTMRDNILGRNGDIAQAHQVAALVTGSTIGAWAVTQALQDRITGNGPTDPSDRAKWLLTHQPYSIRFGDRWVSAERFGSFGVLLGVSANLAEVGHQVSQQDYSEAASRIAYAAHEMAKEVPGMQGIADVMEAMQNWDRNGARYVTNMAANVAVPYSTGVSQAASIMDPQLREAKTFVDALKYKVPGMRQTLLPVRDWTGSPVENPREGMGAILKSKPVNTNPVDLEMQRLGIKPSLPDKHINGVELTPEQYDRFQSTTGPFTRQALQSRMDQKDWAGMPDSMKEIEFMRLIQATRKMGGATMMMENDGQLIKDGLQLKRDRFQDVLTK